MVLGEDRKQLTLLIGKLVGIIAILLLLIGPFQPYWVSENRTTGEIGASTLMDHWYDNSESVVPFITVIMILVLLFPQMPFYFERDSRCGKINHIFLMLWGASFFLSFLRSALRFTGTSSLWRTYPGYGHWMIVVGFFLCGLGGFLAWGGFTKEKLLKDEKIIECERKSVVDSTLAYEPEIQIIKKHVEGKPVHPANASMTEPETETEHVLVPPTIEPQESKIETKESTSEEVKMLRRWARHIDGYSQTYELCINCQNYVFMKAKDTGDHIVFVCPECNVIFKLKK